MFWSEPRKRKSRKQKAREKGRRSYRKGIAGEKKADPLLARKGFQVHKTRVHSKKRAEFDRLATDKHGRTYGVEVKYTKNKVTSPTIRKLKRKVDKSGLLHGGIVVAKEYTASALGEAKHLHIKTYKFARKKRKRRTGWFF